VPAGKRHILGLFVGLMLAPAAFADFKQSYARGKEAAADGRWTEVEARMREAMAEQAQPQARVRIYGMRFETYVPQYYLGLAAFRQGNCAAALQNWQHAATASIVAGEADMQGVVNQGTAECRRKAGTTSVAQTPVSPSAPTGPGTAPTTTPAGPRTTAPTSTPSSTPGSSTSPVTRPIATAPSPTPPQTTRPAPTPPTTAPATPRPAGGTAPAALVGAIDGYLAGRFEQAANLDLSGFSENRARFHALLLRSAARHTLSQAGDERAEALLAAAQADIRAARALQPGQAPDPALFSPRYRRLFEATR
jgi:hypothetical protein